ncbi:26293_t:CDS:2, partial [Gigaspora margarita]
HIRELEIKNAKISNLRKKILEVDAKRAEFKAKYAKLQRQFVKENKRHDTKNTKLKFKVVELEARLVIVEQGFLVSLQNNKEKIAKILSEVVVSDVDLSNVIHKTATKDSSSVILDLTHYKKDLFMTSIKSVFFLDTTSKNIYSEQTDCSRLLAHMRTWSQRTFWDGFEKIVNTKGQERIKCKTCNKSWAKNETRMQEHYNYCKLKNFDNSNTSSSTSNQKELESLLARGFYSAGISFNILENDDIKAFFSRALPYFKLPTRYSLLNSFLTKEYSDLNTIINYLFNETQFLCLVTDGWSNICKDSIINFMITTPKPLFYKSVHTKEDQHTVQNIAKGIDKVMQELGVDKFVAVITNNAPNIKATWHILKNQYPTKVFLRCWAHGINLWIKDILKLDWPKNTYNFFSTNKESIGISSNIKIHLMNNLFWQNLKHLRNFLEPFVKFFHELEEDVPLLSAAIRLVEQCWNDFLYNPATMAAYKLDSQYCGEILDPNKWDVLIERELIHLARPENEDQDLEELSEYVGKTSEFLANYLWWNLVKARYPVLSDIALKLFSIPATLASSEHNWSSFNFVHSKLLKELRNRSYLIEDNVVNLELNETNSVEENNIDDSLSDSPLYID